MDRVLGYRALMALIVTTDELDYLDDEQPRDDAESRLAYWRKLALRRVFGIYWEGGR